MLSDGDYDMMAEAYGLAQAEAAAASATATAATTATAKAKRGDDADNGREADDYTSLSATQSSAPAPTASSSHDYAIPLASTQKRRKAAEARRKVMQVGKFLKHRQKPSVPFPAKVRSRRRLPVTPRRRARSLARAAGKAAAGRVIASLGATDVLRRPDVLRTIPRGTTARQPPGRSPSTRQAISHRRDPPPSELA